MNVEPLQSDPDDDAERSDTERYSEASRFVRQQRRRGHLRLIASDGDVLELPDRLADVLSDAAGALAAGEDVRVVPTEKLLTTSQAAELLSVSRPTLVRLLEQGEMSYAQPGTHRRLNLSDVLAYRDERRRRRAALKDMVEAGVDAGLYELLEDDRLETTVESAADERNHEERRN